MKNILIILALAILVFLGFLGVSYIKSVDLGDRTVSVIIEPGEGFNSVADQLVEFGVVNSHWMLKYPARWRGVDRKLVPGRYDFTGTNSCRSVLDKLESGDFLVIKVTVYEGAPIWKVASILAARMEVDSAEVIARNGDSAYLAQLDLPCLEGYLYPETYFWPWGTDLDIIIKDMVMMHRKQTEDIWSGHVVNGLSKDEIIVMASIIEAEALLDDEKPRISSVYQNRIRKGMRLDADPTVIYGLGGLDRPLSRRDLRQVTPYNTYRKKGLPPTAINSPGIAAIRAALNPEVTEYLYFVADGTGRHRFSKSNAEHNRARRDIKRGMKARGQ